MLDVSISEGSELAPLSSAKQRSKTRDNDHCNLGSFYAVPFSAFFTFRCDFQTMTVRDRKNRKQTVAAGLRNNYQKSTA